MQQIRTSGETGERCWVGDTPQARSTSETKVPNCEICWSGDDPLGSSPARSMMNAEAVRPVIPALACAGRTGWFAHRAGTNPRKRRESGQMMTASGR